MEQEDVHKIKKNGQAAAAILASMIGILSLAMSNLLAEISKEFKLMIYEVGKVWIPGAEGIGPYSGKETFMLVAWGLSWLILYFMLRNRNVKLSYYTITFMIGTGISTLLVWNPFLDLIK